MDKLLSNHALVCKNCRCKESEHESIQGLVWESIVSANKAHLDYSALPDVCLGRPLQVVGNGLLPGIAAFDGSLNLQVDCLLEQRQCLNGLHAT